MSHIHTCSMHMPYCTRVLGCMTHILFCILMYCLCSDQWYASCPDSSYRDIFNSLSNNIPNSFLTQRRGSSPAVFSASHSGTATSQIPTPHYLPHRPQPLQPAAACPPLPRILEQEEMDSLPPNGATISGTPRQDYHPAYLIEVPHCHQNVTEHSITSGH